MTRGCVTLVCVALSLCFSGSSSAAKAPMQRIELAGNPAAVVPQTIAGHQFLCGVWANSSGELFLECIPQKTKRPKVAPKSKSSKAAAPQA
jgi:hypothetical protein